MKKFFSALIALIIIGCSGSADTSKFLPEEHFGYAKTFYEKESYYEALQEFKSILLQYPGNSITDDAQFYLGKTYFAREEYILAAYEFSKLIRNIPASEFVPESQYMLAESYYQLSPPPELDQEYSKKCIEEFQAFLDFFPNHEKAESAESKIKEMNEKLAEKEFENSRIYEKMEYYNAAIISYDLVATKFHDTKFAPLARVKKIELLAFKERNKEAMEEINKFFLLYPNSKFIPDVIEIKEELASSN